MITPRPSLTNPHALRMMRDRALAVMWSHCKPHLAFLVCLLLTLALCRGCLATAAEVPDGILRGLVMVESGCDWRGVGDVRGRWSRGADGEVSPFQLAPAALADMGAADRSARIHRDPTLAESFARLWLSRCFQRHGNWRDALAAYNAGSRYRSRTARDYADRVLNLAAVL